MLLDKVIVDFTVFGQPFGQTSQERDITTDLNLNDLIDHLIALSCSHMGWFLRISKLAQTLLAHRIDRDNTAALLMRVR